MSRLPSMSEPATAHNYNSDNHDRMSLLRCHDGPCLAFFGSRFSQDRSVLRFISKSISTYVLVVSIEAWPNHERIILRSTLDCSRCIAVVRRMV
jgi:hypothetical protein